MGIPVPKEYGGQGCDILTYAMCVEELAKVCGTTSVIVSAHTSLCADPILNIMVQKSRKRNTVPKLASGREDRCISVLQSQVQVQMLRVFRLKLYLDGDEWVLNGSKCFITNGKVC